MCTPVVKEFCIKDLRFKETFSSRTKNLGGFISFGKEAGYEKNGLCKRVCELKS